MIDRLTYRYIELEITRRCNLKCAHCLRGDAQDVDMKPETIDAFLDHTQAIYGLLFTGGEPTLNIDGMRYFLNAAKKRNVLISGLNIVTNGVIRNDKIITLMEDYSSYIQKFLLDDVPVKSRIVIGVSVDNFHETDSEDAYKWYSEKLSHIAIITRTRTGDIPYAIGKGKDIPYATPRQTHPWRIEYLSNNHSPICTKMKGEKLFHPNQIIILCGILITAYGEIVPSKSLSYQEEDGRNNHICSVFVNSAHEIIENIERYNSDKKYCVEYIMKEENKSFTLFDMLMNYRELKKMKQRLENHPNPVEYLSKLAIKNLDKPEMLPMLLELNGNKPLDYSTVGVDSSDVLNILQNMHTAYCEMNNTSPEVRESLPQRIKEIDTHLDDQERKQLYDRAIEIRLQEYFPIYSDLASKNLTDLDKERWSLLYDSYQNAVNLFKIANKLHKIKPDSDYYKHNKENNYKLMRRDFDKLVSFIRAHPIRK